MEIITTLLVLTALAGAWILWGQAFYRVETLQSETYYVTTPDGWRICLHRYLPEKPTRLHPVLLCPGLGANRVSYDLGKGEVSLARHLAGEGYDVWVLELRGHGISERPRPFSGRTYGWSLEDYFKIDVPAALERVLKVSGAERIHWIGHSMGGIVLFCHLLHEGGTRIRSATTVASSLDYSGGGSHFEHVAKLENVMKSLAAFPLGPFTKLVAPLSSRVDTPLERFNVYPPGTEGLTHRKLVANAFQSVSMPVMMQLRTALLPGGLCVVVGDGEVPEQCISKLGDVDTPLFVVGGDRDKQCPPRSIEGTYMALGSQDKKLRIFGLEGQGAAEKDHYGHFDLLMGKRSDQEVFPEIVAWLNEHDKAGASVS